MTFDSMPRRTFAIISHPDAGKTTLTEKLLLFGGAITLAGSVKGRKAERHATSDWMALEQKRGISVTTSVMQFPYKDNIVNLLDTPGHGDFSEDTYRTLTAVDSALMVIDVAKGVEDRTIKLMGVCRLRQTPIVTFINKCDREGKDPIELMDEIESVLNITCVPMTWPVGMGKGFKGIYHFLDDCFYLYDSQSKHAVGDVEVVQGLESDAAKSLLGSDYDAWRESADFAREVCPAYDESRFLAGEITPVYFGSAINNFGVRELLDGFVSCAPGPGQREAITRTVESDESKFTGFVFKIQANMDPKHHDRIAFMRIVSGQYRKGMKMFHVRSGKQQLAHNAQTFMAGQREHAESAAAGDIIGLHNHGGIKIGDTFTQGESLKFSGIPNFAPELFRRVQLKDPLKQKALWRGLVQLSEEGATQVFRPLLGSDIVLGAIGVLQFDVVSYRLQHEYNVSCAYEAVNVAIALWVECDDAAMLKRFQAAEQRHLAHDAGGHLTYLAPSRVNLQITQEHWPDVRFISSREH